MPDDRPEGLGPHDTYVSAFLRFVMEIFAWVAGPWAAADLAGTRWAAIPALLVLLVAPSVFSTKGDKKQVVVATPGPVRLVIELALITVAVASAWLVWSTWLGWVVSVVALAAIVTGLPRSRWLAAGAPLED